MSAETFADFASGSDAEVLADFASGSDPETFADPSTPVVDLLSIFVKAQRLFVITLAGDFVIITDCWGNTELIGYDDTLADFDSDGDAEVYADFSS